MTKSLTAVEIYTTKDGFNSYMILQEGSKDIVLVDPVSFDINYYRSINSRGLQVTDVILTAKWRKKIWQQRLNSIYHPHIVSLDAEKHGFSNTAHGRIKLLSLPMFNSRAAIHGNCLFMGPINIIGQSAGKEAKEFWRQFLNGFSEEYYVFSCYGPPDTLSSVKRMASL